MSRLYGRLLLPASLLGLFVIYALGFSHELSYDSLTYALEALAPDKIYFNPHHILYNPLMRGILLILRIPPGDAAANLLTLQAANLAISLLAVATFYAVCRTLRLAAGPALLMAALFGMLRIFRTYSTQIEVYNLTALLLLLALLSLVGPRPSRWRSALTPSAYFLAMCFHQTAIFFGAAILAWELLTRDERPLALRLLVNLVLPGAAIGLLYFVIARHLGYHGLGGVSYWMTLYAHYDMGLWGQSDLSVHTLVAAALGLALAFAPIRLAPAVALFLMIYIAARLVEAPGRVTERHRLFLAMAAWLVPAAIFTAWWTPWNGEFWLCPSIPIMIMLAGLGPSEGEQGALRTTPRRVARLALAGTLGVMLVAAGLHTLAERKPNAMVADAAVAAKLARPGDLILTGPKSAGLYYEIYLVGRPIEVVSVEDVAFTPDAPGRCEHAPACVADLVATSVQATAAKGGRILADRSILDRAFGTAPNLKAASDKEIFEGELARTLDLATTWPIGDGRLVMLTPLQPPSAGRSARWRDPRFANASGGLTPPAQAPHR